MNESTLFSFVLNFIFLFFVTIVFEQAEPFATPGHRIPIETVRAAGSLGRRVRTGQTAIASPNRSGTTASHHVNIFYPPIQFPRHFIRQYDYVKKCYLGLEIVRNEKIPLTEKKKKQIYLKKMGV
jgi:hypothetical protein